MFTKSSSYEDTKLFQNSARVTYGYRDTGNQDLQGYYGTLANTPRQKLAPDKGSGVGDMM